MVTAPQEVTTICPTVPGETPTSSEDFATATVSNTVRVEPGSSIGTAEVSCPAETEVTGGGYELREVIPEDSAANPRVDAPRDNGWKVSVTLSGHQDDVFLTVYDLCFFLRIIFLNYSTTTL